MKQKLVLNTVCSLLQQGIAVLCGLIVPRLILVAYGSEVNGLIQSVTQFLGLVTFMELGVGQVLQSALYKPLAEGDSRRVSEVLASGNRFFRRIAQILLVYVLLLMIAYPLLVERHFGWLYTAAMVGILSLGSFAQYYFGIIDRLLLNADQRGYIQYISQMIALIVNVVLSFVLIRMGAGVHMVKLAASLVFMARPFAVRIYIKRHYSLERNVRYEGEPIAQKWNGVAQHVSAVVLEGTDAIVLTMFSTLGNVSVYSVYHLVIAGVKQVYTSATAGLQSAVGALWASGDQKLLRRRFGSMEIVLHAFVVVFFSCTGLLILPFVQVYTVGITDVEYIQPLFAVLLVVSHGIRCLRTPYNIMILAAGHYKQTQRCHIVATVLNLVISVATVSAWGLVGVAIGTLIAFAYQTVWMAVYDAKHLLQRPIRFFVKQLAADGVAVLLICLAASGIELGAVSYAAWFVMAVKVGAVSLVVTGCTTGVFFFYETKAALTMLRKKTIRGR